MKYIFKDGELVGADDRSKYVDILMKNFDVPLYEARSMADKILQDEASSHENVAKFDIAAAMEVADIAAECTNNTTGDNIFNWISAYRESRQ